MCVRVWVGKIWVGRCTGPTTTRANNSTRKEKQRETEPCKSQPPVRKTLRDKKWPETVLMDGDLTTRSSRNFLTGRAAEMKAKDQRARGGWGILSQEAAAVGCDTGDSTRRDNTVRYTVRPLSQVSHGGFPWPDGEWLTTPGSLILTTGMNSQRAGVYSMEDAEQGQHNMTLHCMGSRQDTI